MPSILTLWQSKVSSYNILINAQHDSYWLLSLSVPRPASVAITSDHANPVRPVRSATVTLTCTMELSPSIDVPVTVSILISGPEGLALSSTTPRQVAGNSRTYVSTAQVTSFGRDQSGWYVCEAKATKPSSQFLTDSEVVSGRSQVTVGKIAPWIFSQMSFD